MRKNIKRRFAKILDSRIGKRAVNLYLLENPQFALDFMQKHNKLFIQDINIQKINKPRNFEDLTWLFSCNKANRGIVRLDFNEAAHLFSLARSVPSARILEIGRFTGGSTILFATAIDETSLITSIDISPKNDEILKSVLKKFELENRVELIVNDANEVDSKEEFYDILFIDGDHSYEAASKDYYHWKNSVKKGGHLLFHDCDGSQPGVSRLCGEIVQNDGAVYKKYAHVGSIIDFMRV